MTEDEFDFALTRAKKYARQLNDDILGEREELFDIDWNGEKISFSGLRFRRDDSKYLVFGSPEVDFLAVTYPLSIVQNLSNSIDESTASAIVEENELTVSEETSTERVATTHLLNEIPEDEMNSYKRYIFLMVSDSGYETNFQQTESGAIRRVDIENLMFPYNNFELEDFYNSTSKVIEGGKRASWLVPRTIAVDIDENDPLKTEIQLSTSP